ncbi:hypothetical protein D3C71_1934670 [compost metagenome]
MQEHARKPDTDKDELFAPPGGDENKRNRRRQHQPEDRRVHPVVVMRRAALVDQVEIGEIEIRQDGTDKPDPEDGAGLRRVAARKRAAQQIPGRQMCNEQAGFLPKRGDTRAQPAQS